MSSGMNTWRSIARGPARRAVLQSLAALAAAPTASAQIWPSRPIVLAHGFPPGGPVDTLSRILGKALSAQLGQPLVIESRPGASGTIACEFVARAKPDGYTLLSLPTTFATTAALLRTLPYRPVEDFTFVSMAAEYPFLLVTYAGSPIQAVADIISLARGRSLLFGATGGSVQHLTMELFALKAAIHLQQVPYQGEMPAITDLVAERLDLILDAPTVLLRFVTDKKLRPLAVTSANRFSLLPDVPTMVEMGYPDLIVTGYQGIAAPAGLPEAITSKVGDATMAGLADASIVEELKNLGDSPKPSSPGEFRTHVFNDIKRWKNLIEVTHINRT
jgi:tripartite-type tricarboxylate transporter receptor subunit TctC